MTDSTSIPEHLTQDNNEPKTKVVAILLADGWHKVDGYAATSDLIGTFYAVLPDDSRLRGPLTSVLAVRERMPQDLTIDNTTAAERGARYREELGRRVLAVLGEAEGPVRWPDLVAAVQPLSVAWMDRVVNAMVEAGQVTVQRTTYVHLYSLPEPEAKS